MVKKSSINEALLSAISILKSIVYNNNVITNLLEDNVLNFAEEEFDIFDNVNSDSNSIQVEEDEFNPTEEEIPDIDLLN